MTKKNNNETEIKDKKSKLFIILGVLVVLLIIVIVAVYFINNNDSNKGSSSDENKVINNTNEGVIGDKEIEGLKLTNTSLKYENGMSTLETLVTNNNDEPYYLEEFHIIIKDENGNDIINYEDGEGNKINYLVGYVGKEIPSKGNTKIETSIDFDISSSAYKITYEIAK